MSEERSRWPLLAIFVLSTAINYLDRQTLSVAAPVLSEQFHMSDVDYSRVTTAFLFAYTIMNGVSGPLIDRLGTKLGVLAAVSREPAPIGKLPHVTGDLFFQLLQLRRKRHGRQQDRRGQFHGRMPKQ